MFDFVRSHSRLMLGLMVLLIIPSFVFFGVQGYSGFGGGENEAVAVVDGRKITRGEWDAAHRRQGENLRRQMPNLDPAMLDTPQARYETLEVLLRERVMSAAATRQHLRVSDEQLQRELLAVPQLASFRRPDGSFDTAGYRALLQAQGLTPEAFEAGIRQDATVRQVLAGIIASAMPAGSSGKVAIDALLQRREIQVLRFPVAAYAGKVSPTEADLQDYYQSHESEFRTLEQADIEYLVLDAQALKSGVAVSQDDLRKYYDENISRYTVAEERRASHILVKADAAAPADVKEKARSKASGILSDLRKNPARFAELARTQSDDPGSSSRGGDLDYFSRGAMVKPFEDAAFSMKPGEISPLVQSDFGFHIIRLDAVRGGDRKSFDSVRAEIETEVRQQLAQRRYAEVAEQFSNTVYEQSESLAAAMERFKLKPQTATVMRQPAPAAQGVLASPKLLAAVFSDEVLRNKRNTDAIEAAPSQLVSARVLRHQPSVLPPLETVRARVLDRVAAQQAAAMSRQEARARLEALRRSASDSGFAAPVVVSRNSASAQTLPRALLEAALRADDRTLPAFVDVDLGEQGQAIVRINRVLEPEVAEPQRQQFAQAYSQALAAAEADLYYQALKRRFRAEIKVSKPAAT